MYLITEDVLNEAIGGLKVYGQVATEFTVEKLEAVKNTEKVVESIIHLLDSIDNLEKVL